MSDSQNDSVSIKILTPEEFANNKEFYQESFNQISLSLWANILENWEMFFLKHPTNSIAYLSIDNRIVSFVYATPYRDYASKDDTDLIRWHINYIQTHRVFHRNGYAYRVLLACLNDISSKGGRVVTAVPNQMSLKLFEQVIEKFGILSTYKIGVITLSNIEKINFLQEEDTKEMNC